MVLLPFAAAYHLSWVTYTVNALIADHLSKDLALSSTELGLVSASYVLGMAIAQIPLGGLTDRHGPRVVQAVCCCIAAAGALVFASASSLPLMLVGRLLLGIGSATAFTAGAHAIARWFPAERAAFATGLFVMLGSLGAVTATWPAQVTVDALGWRLTFVLMACPFLLCAALTYAVVPDAGSDGSDQPKTTGRGLGGVVSDRRFLKLAPVSALTIGTAWSLQSLWAGPWLAQVEGHNHSGVVNVLFAMAVTLSLAGLVFGAVVQWVQRMGIGLEKLFASILLVFLSAQLALVMNLHIPALLPWIVIASIGSVTVVSYSILATYVSKSHLGRATAALNLAHLSTAFAIQGVFGGVIDLASAAERQPAAHRTALTLILALEFSGWVWFVVPASWTTQRARPPRPFSPQVLSAHPGFPNRYSAARLDWNRLLTEVDDQVRAWRMAALSSMTVLFVLATIVVPRDW